MAKKEPTALAQRRLAQRLSQAKLSARTGVSVATIQRLERRDPNYNPSIRVLTNLALALGCESIEEICEPDWLTWTVFDHEAAEPPAGMARSFRRPT